MEVEIDANNLCQKMIENLLAQLKDPRLVVHALAGISTIFNANVVGNIFHNQTDQSKEKFDDLLENYLAAQAIEITRSVWQKQSTITNLK
jgi:hypothetical protein